MPKPPAPGSPAPTPVAGKRLAVASALVGRRMPQKHTPGPSIGTGKKGMFY